VTYLCAWCSHCAWCHTVGKELMGSGVKHREYLKSPPCHLSFIQEQRWAAQALCVTHHDQSPAPCHCCTQGEMLWSVMGATSGQVEEALFGKGGAMEGTCI